MRPTGTSPGRPWLNALIAINLFLSPAFGWWEGDEFVPGPFTNFKTEPDLKASLVQIAQQPKDLSTLAPGYIFFTAFFRNYTYGPHIVDQNGVSHLHRPHHRLHSLIKQKSKELVWSGQPIMIGRAQSIHVCDYLGESGNHLCFADHSGGGRSHNRILDNSYTSLKREYPNRKYEGHSHLNSHEFRVLEGGRTLLQAVTQDKTVNLEAFQGPADGKIGDCCFQELDVATGRELFWWCWLDNFPIEESHPPGTVVPDDPVWDALHMNSVDKNVEGDYLVSFRSTLR